MPDPATAAEAPPFAAHLVALGAIEFGRREGDPVEYRGAEALAGTVGARARIFCPARHAGRGGVGHGHGGLPRRYNLPEWQPPRLQPGTAVGGFIGLDAGSTSTKAVLLDESGEVVAKAYQLSRGNPIEDGIDMFRALREQVESQGASIDVRGLVTTGYAKDTLHEVFAADAALVETVAHAQSALQ